LIEYDSKSKINSYLCNQSDKGFTLSMLWQLKTFIQSNGTQISMSVILHKKTFQELTTDELYELLRVRNEVFVVEQNCAYQDLDYDDQKSIHIWLTEADKVVALARICPAGTHMKEISIGRVITTERGMGYGKQIMRAAIDAAIEHLDATLIDIEAQEYAKGFYEGVGFMQSSDVFMLDGIPHIKMTWARYNNPFGSKNEGVSSSIQRGVP